MFLTDHDEIWSMSRGEFVPVRLLLLGFVGFFLPIYGLATDRVAYVIYGSVFGGVLFVVRWRWWWEPLQSYLTNAENG